ncbi:hypothetical protein MBLNU457_5997t1 [Dothideomycetes sp. NU457]
MHGGDFPPRSADVSVRPRDLLATCPPLRSKSLSASPFMVSVVIESLQKSEYASRTSVVPGEADAFCAEAGRQGKATILTSDSDLLVHDLGREGKVILFRDIEIVHLASKGKCIKAVEYFPNGIAGRLALPNLVKVAYFMTEGNSFTEAIRLAKIQEVMGLEYREFEQLYGSLSVDSDFADAFTRKTTFSKVLSRLDPRISELVHQLKPLDGDRRSLTMYFPFMIDDPTKTSTWRFGDDIRRIGYSALQLIDQSISSVDEVERKGTRVGSSSVGVLQIEEALVGARELVKKLEDWTYSDLSTNAAWRCFAMERVLDWSVCNMKPLPTQYETLTLALTPRMAPLTWRAIHTGAAVQSVVYSLRIVLQLLAVVVSFCEAKGGNGHEGFRLLLALLGGMPGLAEVLEEEEDGRDQSREFVLERFKRYWGAGDNVRKKRKEKKKVERSEQSTWQKSNPYAALG